jgi:predicted nucleic acid-binding protein
VGYLLDANVLVRLANSTDALHTTALNAVDELDRRGEILHRTPQTLIEFRNVATRPVNLNGLGMATVDVEVEVAAYESQFPLLEDTPDIYPAWKAMVSALVVTGKQVHDARLVAVCHVHGITHLLTFNTTDFARFSSYGPGLVVVDPATV